MKIRIDGQKLAYVSMKKGMSQKDLVETSKVSKATISAAANGHKVFSETAAKICKALDCEIEDIMSS